MKYACIASAFLAAMAVAQPHGNHHQQHHQKRAIVTKTKVVTEIEYVTELVDSTTTVWITPGAKKAEPTTESTTSSVYVPPPVEKKPKEKKPTYTPPPPAPTTTTSIYVPPPPPPETTTSVYVPPAEPTYVAPAPAPEPEKPKAKPKPKTTTKYTPPAQPTYVAPEPSTPSDGGNGGGSGSGNTGDVTFYQIGVGACGDNDAGKDESVAIVALSHLFMGEQSNGNPYCGKTVTITVNGKTAKGIVKDKCMGCAINDIDVSMKLFADLGIPESDGRVTCSWTVDE